MGPLPASGHPAKFGGSAMSLIYTLNLCAAAPVYTLNLCAAAPAGNLRAANLGNMLKSNGL
jgi:hypothetical protein